MGNVPACENCGKGKRREVTFLYGDHRNCRHFVCSPSCQNEIADGPCSLKASIFEVSDEEFLRRDRERREQYGQARLKAEIKHVEGRFPQWTEEQVLLYAQTCLNLEDAIEGFSE